MSHSIFCNHHFCLSYLPKHQCVVELSLVGCHLSYLFNVHVIKVVLNKLDSGVQVSLVELIGDVPSQRAILSPFLYCAVEKCNSIQHWLPLYHVTDIQQVLVYTW